MAWVVIRVRGGIHAKQEILDTLDLLHLNRPNHATILPEAPAYRGMLTKVQGYVTWGEAEPETVGELLKSRAETLHGESLGAPKLPETVPAKDLPELTRAVLAQGLSRSKGLKPLLRLHAPKGGWRSTKKPFALGGALGYRGRAINDLAQRMMR
ncbi:MAG TPA: 50S ribosomal protein L30 [Thermoplasmata archaeon]|nr:50S ribosomal protein L30 [Thermoplasmata archaeon]